MTVTGGWCFGSNSFLHFGADFPLKFLLKSISKLFFFPLWCRDPALELQFLLSLLPLRVVLLRFAATVYRSQWNGCKSFLLLAAAVCVSNTICG